MRENLEGLVERSIRGGKPESHRAVWEDELAGAPFPEELVYLWRIYNRLRRRQGSSGWGPLPVSWSAIDAFVRHSKFNLVPWEVEIIEMLDDVYMRVNSKRKTEKAEE